MKRQSPSEPPDERDELWELLGQADKPPVDPRFVGKMRQRVAGERQERRSWGWKLPGAPWHWAAGATAMAVLAAIMFLPRAPEPATPLAVNHLPDEQKAAVILESAEPKAEAVSPAGTPLDEDDAALMVAMLPALLEMEAQSEWAELFESAPHRDG